MPDDAKDDFISAFCEKFRYRDEILNEQDQPIPNPMSREDFVQDQIANWMLEVTKDYLLRSAETQAREEAMVGVDNRVANLVAWFNYVKEHGEEPPNP